MDWMTIAHGTRPDYSRAWHTLREWEREHGTPPHGKHVVALHHAEIQENAEGKRRWLYVYETADGRRLNLTSEEA